MKDTNASLDDLAPKKREKRTKKFHSTKGATLDIALRRQVAAELGEEEPTKDQRYILLQKFGVISPKIDRLMTRPSWMSVAEFKRKSNEWYQATRGMVQPQQQKRRPIWPKNEPRQRGTNNYPRNSGRMRQENLPKLRPAF